MIKYWQSMHDYLHFFNESRVHFDSSERTRLHTELWKPWQKLRLFNTDRAMEFLLPFYSCTGRPALNQPQILRSLILFFFLFSEGLAPPSLTLWIQRLSHDRVVDKMGQDKHDDMYKHIIECVLIDNRMQSKEENEKEQ